jgi:hypothetical protein
VAKIDKLNKEEIKEEARAAFNTLEREKERI